MGRKQKRNSRRIFRFLLCIVVIVISTYLYLGLRENKEKFREVQQSVRQTVQKVWGARQVEYSESDIPQEDLTGKYYYQMLDKKEQKVYREVKKGIEGGKEAIYVRIEDADRTNVIFQYVLKDFPEIFWCDGTVTSTSYKGREAYTEIRPSYVCGKEERKSMEKQIQNTAQICLSGISQEASDYEKILYVYEYIIETVDYDLTAEHNQNIYSVLVNHRSVCAGYSKAAQYLLERLGVFCTYITGTTTNGQSHAWNLVKCDGDYYYVDTTWGDPVFQSQENREEKQEHISYDYMCCDDAALSETHIPDKDISLPACNSMKANYYVVNGMYYRTYDRQKIIAAMNQTIDQKENSTILKFADSDTYREAHDEILQNIVRQAAKNLAFKYKLSRVSYRYTDSPEQNKIVIYWQYD